MKNAAHVFTIVIIANFLLCSLRQRHFTPITQTTLFLLCLPVSLVFKGACAAKLPTTNQISPTARLQNAGDECTDSGTDRCQHWPSGPNVVGSDRFIDQSLFKCLCTHSLARLKPWTICQTVNASIIILHIHCFIMIFYRTLSTGYCPVFSQSALLRLIRHKRYIVHEYQGRWGKLRG